MEQRFATRLAICSSTFKNKIQLSFEFVFSSSIFSVQPSLRFIRVVQGDSPGFAFIDSLYISGEDKLVENLTDGSLSQELLMLFEKREATPYDTLEDGRTLLHVRYVILHQTSQLTVF